MYKIYVGASVETISVLFTNPESLSLALLSVVYGCRLSSSILHAQLSESFLIVTRRNSAFPVFIKHVCCSLLSQQYSSVSLTYAFKIFGRVIYTIDQPPTCWWWWWYYTCNDGAETSVCTGRRTKRFLWPNNIITYTHCVRRSIVQYPTFVYKRRWLGLWLDKRH